MGRAEDLFSRIEARGLSAIDDLITDRVSEELFLDFKNSADAGGGTKLHKDDNNNLAVSLSGFGNAEGGLLIWGVDCRRMTDGADVAQAKRPIQDAARFVSWLESAISGRTVPAHSAGVRSIAIREKNSVAGYVVTLIPKCPQAPLQAISDGYYYVRAGSSFVRMQHSVLAGMFGRRPEARVFQTFTGHQVRVGENGTLIADMGILLYNEGPGVAQDLYCNLTAEASLGGPNQVGFSEIDRSVWMGHLVLGVKLNLIARPEVRLAPEAMLLAIAVSISIRDRATEDLRIVGSVGCSSSPPARFTFESKAQDINATATNAKAIIRTRALTNEEAWAVTRAVYGQTQEIEN